MPRKSVPSQMKIAQYHYLESLKSHAGPGYSTLNIPFLNFKKPSYVPPYSSWSSESGFQMLPMPWHPGIGWKPTSIPDPFLYHKPVYSYVPITNIGLMGEKLPAPGSSTEFAKQLSRVIPPLQKTKWKIKKGKAIQTEEQYALTKKMIAREQAESNFLPPLWDEDYSMIPGIGRAGPWADESDRLNRLILETIGERADVHWGSKILFEPEGPRNLAKWQTKFIESRYENLFKNIDPRSFEEEYAAKLLGFGKSGNELYEVAGSWGSPAEIQERTELLEGISSKEERNILEESRRDVLSSREKEPESWYEDVSERSPMTLSEEMERSGIIETEGLSTYERSKRAKIQLSTEKVSIEQIGLRASGAQYFHAGNKRYGTGRPMRFGKYTSDEGFLGMPSPNASAVYADEPALLEYYQEALGQKKTLVPEKGTLNWENMKIVGKETPVDLSYAQKVREIIAESDALMAAKDPFTFKKRLKSFTYSLAGNLKEEEGDLFKSSSLSGEGILDVPPQTMYEMLDELKQARYNKKARYAAKKKIKKMTDTIKNYLVSEDQASNSQSVIKKMNAEGFNAIQEEIQSSQVGDVFVTAEGQRARVEYAESLSQLMVRTTKESKYSGSIVSMQQLEEDARAAAIRQATSQGIRKRFRLAAVRTPSTREGKLLQSTVELYWGTGELAGYMESKVAKEYFKNIESGYLGTVEAQFTTRRNERTARLFSGEKRLGQVVGTGTIGGLDVIDEAGSRIKDRWERAYQGESALLEVDKTSEYVFSLFHPPKVGRTRMYDRVESGLAKTENRMWVALSIAAGAMLMWGASKIRGNQPMSEKDVPKSMYGSVDLASQPQSATYTPATRITPTNTGYSTNIDLETTDMRGTTDYRPLANSLGSISSSVLGVGRTNTSLHIVDDSERMDRESTRRKMNQMLGA